jgi:hypothetical protein
MQAEKKGGCGCIGQKQINPKAKAGEKKLKKSK